MGSVFRVAAVILLVAAFGATVEAVRIRSVRAGDRETMRIGVEDVVRRVKSTTANLATVIELSNKSALAKARALARIVADDPTVLSSQERFAALGRLLDVDELHVSNEKGILIRSVPESTVGFDMNSAEQPRPFMKAITDKSFELAQEPTIKAIDGELFQYAGVARIDKPGIVQIGQKAVRVAEARNLADIASIAESARIGRQGRVFISKIAESRSRTAAGFREEQIGSERFYCLDADVGSHRIHVLMPIHGSWLGDDFVFVILCILDALIVVIMLFSRFASVRRMLKNNFHSLVVLFGGVPSATKVTRRQRTLHPVVFACLVLFVVTVVLGWIFVSHATRVAAEERLLNAAEDMREDIDKCVDQQLFYTGNAICKSYGSPEALTPEGVKEVMRRYDIDELNVVDSRGIITAGDLAEIGFRMDSNPNSAKFNRLLEGEQTYSQPFRGAIENPDLRRKYAGVAFPPPAKGYIQMGFAEHRLKDGIDYWFAALAEEWKIGERGFFVVAKDETGEIDSCGLRGPDGEPVFRRGDTLASIGFDVSAAPESPTKFFEATLYGEPCLCLSEVRCFHRAIAAMPLSEISSGGTRTLLIAVMVFFLIFVLVAVFMTRLSDLVTSLKGYIAEAESRVEKEMAMAKSIQTNALPTVFPPYPNFTDRMDIFARMITAREVGGDFYDFYFTEPNRLALVIADVSGKGVPAALFMMRAKATIQSLLRGGARIDEAISAANDRLAESNDANMFVTAWIGVVDITTGVLEYVNAGHNPPLLRRESGGVEYLTEKSGPPLAALGGMKYRRKTLRLGVGDGLILYTDGITEAVNRSFELFGETRFRETVSGLLGTHDAEAMIAGVVKAVFDFAGDAEQADDMTLLAFKLRTLSGG